jgi:hypothetical protein
VGGETPEEEAAEGTAEGADGDDNAEGDVVGEVAHEKEAGDGRGWERK